MNQQQPGCRCSSQCQLADETGPRLPATVTAVTLHSNPRGGADRPSAVTSRTRRFHNLHKQIAGRLLSPRSATELGGLPPPTPLNPTVPFRYRADPPSQLADTVVKAISNGARQSTQVNRIIECSEAACPPPPLNRSSVPAIVSITIHCQFAMRWFVVSAMNRLPPHLPPQLVA
jgi:hypothetical protein